MATLAVIFGMGQKCPSCGQRSSPKIDRGDWEVIGLWGGSIKKCMKCNSLVRIGFLSDEVLFKEESKRLLESEGILKIISDQQSKERDKDVE
ncbi:MAG: hypothetical protein IIC11_09040 [Proteobacteria bacterium]|nr:hypothetical protein [Pseudomonadota bacterium]